METPASLLERLWQPGDQDAWARFVELYTPLLYSWARRAGLREPDAADLVQDVFTVLIRKLPEFRYDRDRSFRAWLRTVTLNKWRENRRRAVPVHDPGGPPLEEIAAPEDGDSFEETEYRRHLVGRALELIWNDFQPTTWEAWCAHGLAGRPAAAVAGELGLTVKAVYLAKARVLRRLRQELAGLLE
jgi:RNA polymerase sigma-70 factor (ECF subfamily)